MIVGIDGSCSDLFGVKEEEYDRAFKSSFVHRLVGESRQGLKKYLCGPSLTGIESLSIKAAAVRFIEQNLSVAPKADIFLAGYSRGGAICLEVAHELLRRRRDAVVRGLFLFDAVAREPQLKYASTIPENVVHAYHARRDPAVHSRDVFGNCGLSARRSGALMMKFFHATHGGLGGIPWTADPSWSADHPEILRHLPSRSEFEVSSSARMPVEQVLEHIPTTTPKDDEKYSRAVRDWMWANMRKEGAI
jgi:pimeloyl-ACP methyl ester carboxylesterase